MLSIEQCKKILQDNGENKYTDDEIKKIRDFFYDLTELAKEQLEFEEQQKALTNGSSSNHVESI